MTAELKFDLNDPDDANRFELCNKSMDMGLLLWEIAFNKRNSLYEFESAEEAVSKFYEWFNEELHERGINIESLIR